MGRREGWVGVGCTERVFWKMLKGQAGWIRAGRDKRSIVKAATELRGCWEGGMGFVGDSIGSDWNRIDK